jgi:hypothetical protein
MQAREREIMEMVRARNQLNVLTQQDSEASSIF